MIEPILSLAFSVHSSPGVYALLLGSGVSKAAQIPTGWDIMIDLIRKLATLKREDDGSEFDPVDWYQKNYSVDEPDYPKLLYEIAKTPSDRRQLLKSYFEPTAQEIEEGGIKFLHKLTMQ